MGGGNPTIPHLIHTFPTLIETTNVFSFYLFLTIKIYFLLLLLTIRKINVNKDNPIEE